MMGLSGALIIFRADIEGLSAPHSSGARPSEGTAWDAIQRQLRAVNPAARITKIEFPVLASGALLIQAESGDKQELEIFAEPGSGAFLGFKKKVAWLDWLVDLHQNLLSGKRGRALTGIIGIALLGLSLSGLTSWLAGRRDWKRALALPKSGPWRRVNYELHKCGGLWANAMLVVISATGIILAYPDAFKSAAKPVSKQRMGRIQFLPIDAYLKTAMVSVPDGVVRELRMPKEGRSTVTITLSATGDIRPKGGNTVVLDAASGEVVSVERSATWPASKKLEEYANAIHKVEYGGMPLKAVWALLGFVPVLLAFSGAQIWWHRRLKTRKSNLQEFLRLAGDHRAT
jgi:uncharacterized iron-regulated membrane protein